MDAKTTIKRIHAEFQDYGLTVKTNKAIEWLADPTNNEKIKSFLPALENGGFDFPEYMGMPAYISKALLSDEVDSIQEYVVPILEQELLTVADKETKTVDTVDTFDTKASTLLISKPHKASSKP